jgi:hypothetical protein
MDGFLTGQQVMEVATKLWAARNSARIRTASEGRDFDPRAGTS